ncbi:MAG: nitrate reductase, partial [Gammaproteobacteria bacterium]|nr:nitrate reductase [Gammaproteobacteria bacterium]
MGKLNVKTTCPYCGVGCGMVAFEGPQGTIKIKGDKTHPANYGRLCSKGASVHETLGLKDRLLSPVVHGKEVDWDSALDQVANSFREIIDKHGPDSVAFYVSGQLLTEDYYVANKLMKGYIGSANIDTNSRLCMSSSVAGHKRAFGADTVPCSYEDLELADVIVLVGSNTAWCHPVLFQRIQAAQKENPNLKLVVVDPRGTETGDATDLHLQINSGSDAFLFNGLLSYLVDQGSIDHDFVSNHTNGFDATLRTAKETCGSIKHVSKHTGCSITQIETFYELFSKTENVVTVYSQGINQSSSGTDKVNAIINCHLATARIGKPGSGPFSFTGQPNAMGGREVGGLANMLAAHMDIQNPAHQSLVQSFWKSPRIAKESGLKAVDLFKAIDEGKVKALWVMATNPVVSLPNADTVKKAIQKCELVVVSDCMANTDTMELAHIKLPALAWGEKDGTVTNSERRISRQRSFLTAPGQSKADWWIISEVAKRMGFENVFSYRSAHEIFCEHAALTGYQNDGRRDLDISGLSQIDSDSYMGLAPTQWPVNQNNPTGKTRFFSNGHFYTENGKANFIAVTPQEPVSVPDRNFPFRLNTGRVRDQWHTMTRTTKAARLNEHTPEPYLAIHPRDAARNGLEVDGLAKVSSPYGEMTARVKLDQKQSPGQVFIPMHWTSQFSLKARVNSIVNDHVDPVSGQPELKHTPVKVEPYRPNWFGFLLSKRELPLKDLSYWTKIDGAGFYRYEIAGEQSPLDWSDWARDLLCTEGDSINWVELADPKARRYRGIRMEGDALESCLFIGPNTLLPPRDWLATLFSKDTISVQERNSLLLGKSSEGLVDDGKRICACFAVGEKKILNAMKKG